MFEKIKEVAKSSDAVTEINLTIKENKEELSNIKQQIMELNHNICGIKEAFASQINEVKEMHNLFLKTFKQDLEKVEDFNKQFEGLVEDFRTQRHKMQELAYEKTSAGIQKEIDRLNIDVSRYNELKGEIDGISPLIMNLKDEVSKFKEISQKLKSQDFELLKFTDKVAHIENEKAELSRKIDSLQRLISKERRRRN